MSTLLSFHAKGKQITSSGAHLLLSGHTLPIALLHCISRRLLPAILLLPRSPNIHPQHRVHPAQQRPPRVAPVAAVRPHSRFEPAAKVVCVVIMSTRTQVPDSKEREVVLCSNIAER